ncbi:MAG: tetratricopeptide repeat protein [Desulforhopalus sp.]
MNCKAILFLLLTVLAHGPGWLQATPADSKEALCEKEAMALAGEGNFNEGLAAIRQCIEKAPSRAKSHVVLGYLLIEKGEMQQAMASFERALELRPRSSAAKTGKGIILSRAGEYRAAEPILKEALQLNPDPARTYYELGIIYQQLGDIEQALVNFKAGITSYEQNSR